MLLGTTAEGAFTIKSATQRRDDEGPIDEGPTQKWETIWKIKVQQGARVFLWVQIA